MMPRLKDIIGPRQVGLLLEKFVHKAPTTPGCRVGMTEVLADLQIKGRAVIGMLLGGMMALVVGKTENAKQLTMATLTTLGVV
jgi:hypothetical protein